MSIPNSNSPLSSSQQPPSHDALVRTTQTLLLDSQIRDWVVLPLLIIMIAAGLLRTHVGRLLRPPPKPIRHIDARAKSALLRISRLRGGSGGYISKRHWEARRLAWSAREGSLPSSSLSSSSNNNNTTTGWLRQEALLAETEKKALDALQTENGAATATDPLTAAMLPGMDPSTMMVRVSATAYVISRCFQLYIFSIDGLKYYFLICIDNILDHIMIRME